MNAGLRLAALGVILALFASGRAAGDTFKTPHVEARLISDRGSVAAGETMLVALDLTMIPGWHTYWVNPGDTGQPTRIKWTLPEGWQAGDIQWPAPERFVLGPVVNYGYADNVRLVTEVKVPATARSGEIVTLAADAKWLVCEKICIPEQAHLELALPVGASAATSDSAGYFAAAKAALPRSGQAVRLTTEGGTYRLSWASEAELGRVREAYFFAESKGVVAPSAEQTFNQDKGALSLIFPAAQASPRDAPMQGVLSIKSDNGETRAYHVSTALPSPAKSEVESLILWHAVLLAFMGGVILNLMPCVFPVVSMKALALVSHGPRHARAHGLAYGGGVLMSFAVIAAILMALRAGGEQIGWGFQLQSPLVVGILAYVLLLLGLSMSGVFMLGGSIMGLGSTLAARQGLSGSFFTGVLASVVATPCTAPFMGAAVGYALVQPAFVGLIVFLALGAGMAMPFVLLTYFDALLKRLPKPGAWMEYLKQILAFPLYAAAAWLVWVLSVQTGSSGVAAILTGMVLLAFAAMIYGLNLSGLWRRVGQGMAAASILGAIFILGANLERPEATATENVATVYSEAEVDRLRAQGRPVLVNLTASWCITCLVNERTALSDQEVLDAMVQKNVAYLKGDWTNQDSAISVTLQRFGRQGVPLYLLYSPGSDVPEILPQILTKSIMLDALSSLPDWQP